jgi:hypothetical protein
MTNLERIKAMTEEELTDFLAHEVGHGDCYNCPVAERCFEIDDENLESDDYDYDLDSCRQAWSEWLRKEKEDDRT